MITWLSLLSATNRRATSRLQSVLVMYWICVLKLPVLLFVKQVLLDQMQMDLIITIILALKPPLLSQQLHKHQQQLHHQCPLPPPQLPSCLPSTAIVNLENGKSVIMSELQKRDLVLLLHYHNFYPLEKKC